MCGPAGFAVAGIGMQAFGQYQQGQAAKAAGMQNAAELDRAAKERSLQAVQERDIMREEGAQLVSRGRAGFAGANVDLGSATANMLSLIHI